ncbi:MAG: ABC transporter ATP-binding protein [Clostridia bacterium]|nr:ABC transporter ATP-binding protein [Clostridia bacterium]
MSHSIEITNLNKSFRGARGSEVKAVDGLSFVVKKGELFAFLGVNGAGKSTTISILCGTLAKDSGTVIVEGENIDHTRHYVEKLGVVFQNSVLDSALTVRDTLKNRAALYGIVGEAFETRLGELAELLSFEDLIGRTLGKLSGGQKRRIDIARALLHRPEILILDEPTTGLDPQTRKLLWDVVRDLRHRENMTVFLTTHYMEEAADADYVVILDSGRIAAEGTPLSLKKTFVRDYITLYNVPEETVRSFGLPYSPLRDGYRIEITSTEEATALITAHPELFVDYEVTKGKMDDVFLAVTGKSLEGGNTK